MKSRKITEADIAEMKISNLPTRPTSPQAFGGKGYTASDMKAAFDKLPLYLVDCFNKLIEDITGEDGESILNAMKTGINETHTLSDLFSDIISGSFIMYAAGPEGKLGEYLLNLRRDVDAIADKIELEL